MKFLDVNINYLSSIREDSNVVKAARAGIPVIDFAPSSLIASDVRALARKVLELPSASRVSGGIQFFMERLSDQASERV
jgi:MinD-like ATPase involved in chromosome partitioning or flagellar assembly